MDSLRYGPLIIFNILDIDIGCRHNRAIASFGGAEAVHSKSHLSYGTAGIVSQIEQICSVKGNFEGFPEFISHDNNARADNVEFVGLVWVNRYGGRCNHYLGPFFLSFKQMGTSAYAR